MTHPTDERAAVCANCGHPWKRHWYTEVGMICPSINLPASHGPITVWARAATPPTASAPPREEGRKLLRRVKDWDRTAQVLPLPLIDDINACLRGDQPAAVSAPGYRWCNEASGEGYLCSRERGHGGNHEAWTGNEIVDEWPAAVPPPDPAGAAGEESRSRTACCCSEDGRQCVYHALLGTEADPYGKAIAALRLRPEARELEEDDTNLDGLLTMCRDLKQRLVPYGATESGWNSAIATLERCRSLRARLAESERKASECARIVENLPRFAPTSVAVGAESMRPAADGEWVSRTAALLAARAALTPKEPT